MPKKYTPTDEELDIIKQLCNAFDWDFRIETWMSRKHVRTMVMLHHVYTQIIDEEEKKRLKAKEKKRTGGGGFDAVAARNVPFIVFTLFVLAMCTQIVTSPRNTGFPFTYEDLELFTKTAQDIYISMTELGKIQRNAQKADVVTQTGLSVIYDIGTRITGSTYFTSYVNNNLRVDDVTYKNVMFGEETRDQSMYEYKKWMTTLHLDKAVRFSKNMWVRFGWGESEAYNVNQYHRLIFLLLFVIHHAAYKQRTQHIRLFKQIMNINNAFVSYTMVYASLNSLFSQNNVYFNSIAANNSRNYEFITWVMVWLSVARRYHYPFFEYNPAMIVPLNRNERNAIRIRKINVERLGQRVFFPKYARVHEYGAYNLEAIDDSFFEDNNAQLVVVNTQEQNQNVVRVKFVNGFFPSHIDNLDTSKLCDYQPVPLMIGDWENPFLYEFIPDTKVYEFRPVFLVLRGDFEGANFRPVLRPCKFIGLCLGSIEGHPVVVMCHNISQVYMEDYFPTRANYTWQDMQTLCATQKMYE